MSGEPRRDNFTGGGWLMADMVLNITALSVVKAVGLDIPAPQIVFLRALVGLCILAPFLWRRRAALRHPPELPLQILRVTLASVALSASYHAVARVPFALFTAVNYIRPILIMVLAVLLLGERIGPRRWAAAGIALCGVAIITGPALETASAGVLTLLIAVFCGSAAVIVLRRLRDTDPLILMGFHATGLLVLAGPFAVAGWQPMAPVAWGALLAVGVLAQCAQLCFLSAHRFAEAGFLSVIGYLGIVLAISSGAIFFAEIPPVGFYPGAALIIGAGLWVGRQERGANIARARKISN